MRASATQFTQKYELMHLPHNVPQYTVSAVAVSAAAALPEFLKLSCKSNLSKSNLLKVGFEQLRDQQVQKLYRFRSVLQVCGPQCVHACLQKNASIIRGVHLLQKSLNFSMACIVKF